MLRSLVIPAVLALAAPLGAQEAPAGLPAIVLPLPADPASARVSVVVAPGLRGMASLPAELQEARAAMLAGEEIPDADLRALADRRDGLAAQRLVRRLLAATPRGSDSDVAFYGAVAVATGRVWTLPDAVAAMRRLDPATEPPERVAAHIAALYPHAWAGNGLALDAVIDLNGEGRLFGPLSAATREKIVAAGEAMGDGRAHLRLALATLQGGEPTPERLALVRESLARALAGSNVAVQATASNLLALLPAEGS